MEHTIHSLKKRAVIHKDTLVIPADFSLQSLVNPPERICHVSKSILTGVFPRYCTAVTNTVTLELSELGELPEDSNAIVNYINDLLSVENITTDKIRTRSYLSLPAVCQMMREKTRIPKWVEDVDMVLPVYRADDNGSIDLLLLRRVLTGSWGMAFYKPTRNNLKECYLVQISMDSMKEYS